MNAIWKYQLIVAHIQQVMMPNGSQIVHVGQQGGYPCIWARGCPNQPQIVKTIHMRGDGEPIEESLLYVGSCQIGELACHVFQ